MKMRVLFPLVAGLAACSGPAVQPRSVQPAAVAADPGAATITARDMRARIGFLASDALKGRDTPSQGLEAAAAYIASEYTRLGLEPKGDSGGWLQRYPYTRRALLRDSTRIEVTARGKTSTYAVGAEMFAMPGMNPRASGELVFTQTPGPESAGKIVVVNIPGAIDRAWRTALTAARNSARSAGALALVVAADSTIGANQMAQASLRFAGGATPSSIPTVVLRSDLARALPRTGATATIFVPVSESTSYPPNVVAVLEGSDPELKNTYVVLSAHMDHVGVGRPNAQGDSIYNGADDDASGTSAVVEAAEAFASLPTRPLRSIIFLNVSGEEKGLLGSSWFSEHPTVPIRSIVADINMDMVGRNAPDSIVAIGQDYSSLGPLTQEIARNHPDLHLTVSRDIWPQERFFFRSDHFNFARKEIPAIFFFAGTHEDYHQPSDEVQKIDADKAARVARLAYYLAAAVANSREAPAWTEQGLRDVRALTSQGR